MIFHWLVLFHPLETKQLCSILPNEIFLVHDNIHQLLVLNAKRGGPKLLISKTLLRNAPVPMLPKDSMDVAEMVKGVPFKLLVIKNSFIEN